MKYVFGLCLVFLASVVYAEEANLILERKLKAIRTMSAAFEQKIMGRNRELSRSSGRMALSRPGRLRWETNQPMKQLLVADGRNLWIYDVDLEQVTVKLQQRNMTGAAGLFLSGYNDKIGNDFKISLVENGTNSQFDLRAKAKKANFQRVKLTFMKEALTGIELFDQLGQHTYVRLQNIKINPTLPERLFRFKPPKGTDVVHQ